MKIFVTLSVLVVILYILKVDAHPHDSHVDEHDSHMDEHDCHEDHYYGHEDHHHDNYQRFQGKKQHHNFILITYILYSQYLRYCY